MQKYKKHAQKIILLLTISIVAMVGFLAKSTYSCTVTNVISGTQVFGNCSVDISPANGVNVFSNTLSWNVPNAFFLLWVAVYASVAFFLLVQDRSFARFNAITFFGMVLALVMDTFHLVGTNTVIIGVSVFILSIIASFFLHSNR